jgi:hypothetical protein
MSIRIVGCPDKDFTPYVHRAAKFYADCLLSYKMQEKTRIIVKFRNDIKECGYAYIAGKNASGKPRKFLIEINSALGAKDILETIAHEMVHVKQFAYGDMNEKLSRWHDTSVDTDEIDYWFHPWEIEAHGLETALLCNFAINEKLWEVFDDFRNPEKKIRKRKIKWKKVNSAK